MGFLIGAAIFGALSISALVAGVFMQREELRFEKAKLPGKAEVAGYDRKNRSSWYSLVVRIVELADGQLYGCKSGRIKVSEYPVGSVIDVFYAPIKVAGIDIVEVHMISNPPYNRSRVAKVMKKVGLAFLAIAAILIAVGIFSILNSQ